MKLLNEFIRKRKFKPLIVLFLILYFAISLFYQVGLNLYYRNRPREFPDSWVIFTHNKYGYVIDYPEKWRARDFPSGNHGDDEAIGALTGETRCFGCTRFGDIGPTIYVAYKELDAPTIEQVLIWGEERIAEKARDGVYELGDVQTTQIDGNDAVFRTYLHKDGISGELEPAIDTYILREDSAFIFSLDVEPKDYEAILPVFEYVVNSFRSN